jgi:hypothetical protein
MPPFELPEDKLGANQAINPFHLKHKFASGKYRDATVREIIDTDPNFIHWCMNNLNGWELADDAYYYLRHRRLPKCKHCKAQITLDKTGKYWVDNTDGDGCLQEDSENITHEPEF